MSIPDPFDMCLDLVEASSPSGSEGPATDVAESLLRAVGCDVSRQEVSPGRHNLFASVGTPRRVLTTHLDTVPPDLPVRIEGDVLHARGACDAKGAAAAMLTAAATAQAAGVSDFGLLFVVGEETTSDGAIAANSLLQSGDLSWEPERALFGEPTDNSWVSAHPGVLMGHLATVGRAAHSARPQDGSSAIHALLEVLHDVRAEAWPHDTQLGPTHLNVGRFEGGVAANVVSEAALAHLMFRSGASSTALLARLEELIEGRATWTRTCASEPVRFENPTGTEAEPVSFSTDAPFLPALGRPSLLGPGSLSVAHSEKEHVSRADLERAADLYGAWLSTPTEEFNS